MTPKADALPIHWKAYHGSAGPALSPSVLSRRVSRFRSSGTGIRNRSSLDHVLVTINGISVRVLYAGPQPTFAGLDQINVPLKLDLRGSGVANVVLKVDQHQANTVTVDVR